MVEPKNSAIFFVCAIRYLQILNNGCKVSLQKLTGFVNATGSGRFNRLQA
jgi:hypothetical protein